MKISGFEDLICGFEDFKDMSVLRNWIFGGYENFEDLVI